MAVTNPRPVAELIHQLASRHASADTEDGELLRRFAVTGDANAFELLLWRHERMVMGVCRRVLRDVHDAEDAFQATFLALARKARSIAARQAVTTWLYTVAYRVALNALKARTRRQARVGLLPNNREAASMAAAPPREPGQAEIGGLLDEAVNRLPLKYRGAVVLCLLEGRSHAEAARVLRCPLGTVASRLARAKARLRAWLGSRGVTSSEGALTAALVAAGASSASARAAVSVTLQAAKAALAGGAWPTAVSPQVSALAQGVLTAMFRRRLLQILAVVLLAVVGGAGRWLWALDAPAAKVAPAAQALAPGQPQTPQKKTKRSDALGESIRGAMQDVAPANQGQGQVGVDRLGDPLPPGAIMRLGTARLRQPVWVTALAFTADGKQLVSASNHVIRVWDAATGKEVRQLEAINTMGLAVSPLGKVMASAQNSNIQVWDVATGKPKFTRHTPGFAVAISPDGRVLATGGRTRRFGVDPPVELWDLRTGNKLRSLSGSMYQVFGLAFSPNGKSLAAVTCGDSGFSPPKSARKSARPQIVRLWDVEAGKLQELDGHAGGATSLAFSPDRKVLATGGHDGALIWWDSATRKQLRKIKLVEDVYYHRKGNGIDRGGIHALAFAPNGKTIASANHDGTVRLFEAATGKQLQVLRGHAHSVACVAFSPNGKVLASGSKDTTVRLWDTTTGALLNPRAGHDGGVASVLVSADGKRAVSAGHDRTLRIWDLTTARELRTVRDFKSAIHGVALSPDGKIIAVGMEDGNIQLRHAVSGAILRELKGHSGVVRSLSFSPDGKTLASASPSGKDSNLPAKEALRSLRIWDVATGRELPRIDGTRNDWYARFSPDGKWLASYERAVVLRDPATGKEQRRFDSLIDFAFHPDGKSIVGWTTAPRAGRAGGGIAQGKGMVQVSRLADGAELYGFEGPQRPPFIGGLFVLSPDARLLAMAVSESGSWEVNVLRIWEMATGKIRRTLKGHGGAVTGCVFSPDGRLVLTASSDATVLVWDLGVQSEQKPKEWTEKALASLWDDLGNADAARADRAVWALVAAGQQALPLLRKNLPPTPAPHPDWRAWVKDLDSKQFAVRDKSSRALEALGEKAYPLLQKALTDAPPLEVRRRLESLLGRLNYPLTAPKTIRELRAVEVLEHIGTAQARQVLHKLAEGASGARLTDAARASLERLAKRKTP
jgi:RNA polymerase sigma factor (sigma-70 family)